MKKKLYSSNCFFPFSPQIITTVNGARESSAGRAAVAATTTTTTTVAASVATAAATAETSSMSAKHVDNEGNGGDDDEDGGDGDDGGGGEDDCSAAAASLDPAANEHNERIFRRLMPNYQQKEPMSCELCGDVFGMPVSYHMLTTHPGCGHSSGGRGYTSNGTYKTGWSGACGEGGIAWYLLCESCRGGYMKRAAAKTVAAPVAAAAAATAAGPVRTRKTAAVLRADADRRHHGE